MRKYGKFLLLVAAAALAAMAIGAASASAATVNNTGSHSVMTTNLTLKGTLGTIHCQVSMTFYVSANTDTIVTSVTPTNCTPAGTVVTPSNVPVSTAGAPPASPWNPGGVWRDWSGNVSGGGPNDWTGTLHNVQFNVHTSVGFDCSYKGDMPVVYHNNAPGDADGTFTSTGNLPLFAGNAFLCGSTGNLSTTDTSVTPSVDHPFTFSAGDLGFTIS